MKAAVIGASGIGKQHAKWLHHLGVDIAAFVGSSPESVGKTTEVMRELFGFAGTGYWDVAKMLATEEPNIVVVSSPPELHAAHALAALRAGAHVMCEKPLVWSDEPGPDLSRAAREMAQAAEEAGRVFSVNTQYVAAVPYVAEIHQETVGSDLGLPESVFFEIESKGGGGAHQYETIFVDLVPHPLSFLLAAVPNAQIVRESIDCRVGQKETIVTLECRRSDGGICAARFELRNIADGTPSRRLGINDFVLTYEGRNDENGQFRAYLVNPDGERAHDDFVLTNMQRFVAAITGDGTPLVKADTALDGFDLQLDLHKKRRRVTS